MLRTGLALLVLPLLAAAAAARAAESGSPGDIFPYKVFEKTLDNGLKIVAIPYDSPGTVAYFTVVRTGSRNEVEPGHSGFAHFFEHMMFRGTAKYPTAAYNDILKRMGADSNASTSDDVTIYYIVGPKRELETMMDIESDRFKNLKYTEDAFRTEALAVLGEYNKNVSNPGQPMFEKMVGLAFEKHTYKHTTMGFLEDIKAMPGYYDYSLQFFDRYYRPENSILVVVGDLQPERVFELAQRYYGDWKKGYKQVPIPAEPPQKEQKKAHIEWPNPTRPQMVVGYHVPAFSAQTVDTAALDLVSELLFSQSAPLYQELVVEKQWVSSLFGGIEDRRDPHLFVVFARVKSEDLIPKVKQTIDQHIARLQNEPPDRERLERIKSHLRYNFALGLDSPDAVARQVAQVLNLTGEVDTLNQIYEQYRKATPQDVQRLARATFKPTNETMVTLSQAAKEGDKAGAKSPGQGR